MLDLDSLEKFRKIDKSNILRSIQALPNQCQHAWNDAKKINIPSDYKNVKNLIMCGMGGSGLGARIIESIYMDYLNIPLIRINDYDLPNFANNNSLVICSSYSGETEETLENAKQAIKRKSKWIAIGTGNSLIKLAQKEGVPYYKINPVYNPSNQPRMAVGYSIIGQLAITSRIGLLKLDKNFLKNVVKTMDSIIEKNDVKVEVKKNEAKKLALKLKDKISIFISAKHLIGAVHTINNQQNENAKNFSFDFSIPEINHHLMEGLKYPKTNKKNLFAIFIDSKLYPPRIARRFIITQEVIKKNNINYYLYQPESENKLSQAFEVIQFGAYLNFYLSILYNQDPTVIPWVDYFKKRLGQPLGKYNFIL